MHYAAIYCPRQRTIGPAQQPANTIVQISHSRSFHPFAHTIRYDTLFALETDRQAASLI